MLHKLYCKIKIYISHSVCFIYKEKLINFFFFRYQYVQSQPTLQQITQPIAQPTITNNLPYQVVPSPVQYQQNVQAPVQYHQKVQTPVQYQQNVQIPTTRMLPAQAPDTYNQQKALELGQISQLAQAAAQKYLSPNPYQANVEQRQLSQGEEPVHSVPPIITGLENFSPEQQAKIKEQLSKHFGAPLQPLHLDKDIESQIQAAQRQSDKYQSSGSGSAESSSVEDKSGRAGSQSSYTKM